jgi:4-diphosphocytidyl-2-C-methyl-D-erythritol kinase
VTTDSVRLGAPAKINWTLEVLRKRDDGYHEIRSIMQALDWSDNVTLERANDISLSVVGSEAKALEGEVLTSNLAYRAAHQLCGALGPDRGVRITVEKNVPVAAGLGGGSSDAAAALVGLNELWGLGLGESQLTELASDLGSDVPFFIRCGTASASGRGELIEPLTHADDLRFLVAHPKHVTGGPKTARMYAALRPEHYTDGSRTEALTERLLLGHPPRDEDCFNVFEAVLPEVDPDGADLFHRTAERTPIRPHLCGSGPAFFFLLNGVSRTAERELDAILLEMGLRFGATWTVPDGRTRG